MSDEQSREKNEMWNKLVKVFQQVFDDVHITEATTADDIPAWDSLNHIRLIVAVEKAFHVRFSTGEVGELANVGDLLRALEVKLREPASFEA